MEFGQSRLTSMARRVPFVECPAAMPRLGPIELVVIQPTPFCNLDCTYCYLPGRNDRSTIGEATLVKAVDRITESGLLGEPVSFVWHAGEPMVAGREFYRHAFTLIRRRMPADVTVRHCFQTNGVLIDSAWCELFEAWDVNVGVSVDGPGFIHDRYRKSRNGKGTHDAVMSGIHELVKAGIGFHTISVLTDYALDFPEEMFRFFQENRIHRCGFNIEEQERVNTRSSLARSNVKKRFREFYRRFYQLNRSNGYPLEVREFRNTTQAIRGWSRNRPDQYAHSQELEPYRIVNIDTKGDFSSFSPEMHGERIERYGRFVFGNVHRHSLAQAARSNRFRRVCSDIRAGIDRCQRECSYFSVCGGGAPSNKYYENGRLDSTETLFCTLQRKQMVDLMLDEIELHARRA